MEPGLIAGVLLSTGEYAITWALYYSLSASTPDTV
jgi:hypothetical protein